MCFSSVPCPVSPEAIHLISIIQHSRATRNIHTKDGKQPHTLHIQQAEPCQEQGKARFQGTTGKLSLSAAISCWKDAIAVGAFSGSPWVFQRVVLSVALLWTDVKAKESLQAYSLASGSPGAERTKLALPPARAKEVLKSLKSRSSHLHSPTKTENGDEALLDPGFTQEVSYLPLSFLSLTFFPNRPQKSLQNNLCAGLHWASQHRHFGFSSSEVGHVKGRSLLGKGLRA